MSACPVCDGTRSGPFLSGLRKCEACSHVWADISLDWSRLSEIYSRDYFFGDEYSNYLDDRRIIEKNFRRRLATLQRFAGSAHRRLFEVGSAYGFFLNLARTAFESVEGIDISEDAVNFSVRELGLNAVCGDLLSADLGPRQFDVACMWDTIEHLAGPTQYVNRLAARMPPGALIAITTGDIASMTARFQKARWRLIHPPTHLQYFSPASMTAMLDRCGFRVRHIEHCGFSRSVRGMVHNLLTLRWRRPQLADRLSGLVPGGLDLYLNLYDIMFVIGERR
jgi:2-polyprenyl-3-methyl-5-hydroxy-6-metoxy-1,4-benzoquinol methylase